MRDMVAGPNRLGIGIDVGWRLHLADGDWDLWWGNTRDEESLKSLVADARSKPEHEFGELIRLPFGKPYQNAGMVKVEAIQ